MKGLWMGVGAALLVAAALACAEPVSQAPAQTGTTKPFFDRPILMVAHRGGGGLWPENTLVAFTNLVARWPDCIIEVDARLTRDGRVVLIHDATVDRTTEGTGRVEAMTLQEIQALDAGYRFTRDGGQSFPFRGNGAVVPTLDEALRAFPEARFQLELKRAPLLPRAAMAVVRELQAEGRVLLASFDPFLMSQARRLAPDIASCYDFRSGTELVRRLRSGQWDRYQPVDDVVSVDPAMLRQFQITREEAQAIRRKGILLQIHTINEPEELRRWLQFGVDSLITDYPDRLAEELNRLGPRE